MTYNVLMGTFFTILTHSLTHILMILWSSSDRWHWGRFFECEKIVIDVQLQWTKFMLNMQYYQLWAHKSMAIGQSCAYYFIDTGCLDRCFDVLWARIIRKFQCRILPFLTYKIASFHLEYNSPSNASIFSCRNTGNRQTLFIFYNVFVDKTFFNVVVVVVVVIIIIIEFL